LRAIVIGAAGSGRQTEKDPLGRGTTLVAAGAAGIAANLIGWTTKFLAIAETKTAGVVTALGFARRTAFRAADGAAGGAAGAGGGALAVTTAIGAEGAGA